MYKKCENDVCPVSGDEEIVKDCGCLNDFADFKAIDVLDSMTGIAECGNDVYGYLHPVQMFDTQWPEVVATNFIPGENVFGDTATLEFAATDKIAIDQEKSYFLLSKKIYRSAGRF